MLLIQNSLAFDPEGNRLPGRAVASNRPLNFENDIIPILTRYGCNTSGCHGKAEGQNGFKLSVFGFDPVADHLAITSESRGRRISMTAPEQSLFLQKASGGLPHGGGVRLMANRPEYETLRRWIGSGAPLGTASDPRIVSLRVNPQAAQLGMEQAQQLRVLANFSDGYQKDVTALATFQSNNEGLARVDDHGLVTIGSAPGDVAIPKLKKVTREIVSASWPLTPMHRSAGADFESRIRKGYPIG